MKAMPMTFEVNSVTPCDLKSRFVDCTILKSFADADEENGMTPNREYRIRFANDIANVFGVGDIFKVIMYTDEKPKTADDYINFNPVGRRIEIMHKGEDVWNLVAMEMKERE